MKFSEALKYKDLLDSVKKLDSSIEDLKKLADLITKNGGKVLGKQLEEDLKVFKNYQCLPKSLEALETAIKNHQI
ncbi:hypothetical phage protein [Campylobacter phage CPt10]|uniref:Uncharacterized protein n=2 Tax=Firehammervirus CPt10 TaxID=722418 RepID=A0A410T7S6_9CAUD|nr:hypothetical protein APL46_gp107 [Campylobacter phage CPt10]QAU04846.1 hypothetical protein [Campylobacter phage CP20]CBJ94309.1 hypothetical phage protein [Campylobacter phage CPt10]